MAKVLANISFLVIAHRRGTELSLDALSPFRRSRDTLQLPMAESATNDPATNKGADLLPETDNPELAAFENLLGRLLAVPHSEVQKRVKRHRKQAAKNPNRPGPKGKRTTRGASRASADDH